MEDERRASSARSFQELLQLLATEHDRSVKVLEEENTKLRQENAKLRPLSPPAERHTSPGPPRGPPAGLPELNDSEDEPSQPAVRRSTPELAVAEVPGQVPGQVAGAAEDTPNVKGQEPADPQGSSELRRQITPEYGILPSKAQPSRSLSLKSAQVSHSDSAKRNFDIATSALACSALGAAGLKSMNTSVRSKWTINPDVSVFLQHWDIFTIAALAFVAVATPVEVAMLETKIDPLFFINRAVDLIFMLDMVLQFFLMYPKKSASGQSLESSHRRIVIHYLKGWFLIDLLSILPFDIVSLVANLDALSKFKAVKVIRLLRLLKLMRVLKASRVFRRLEVNLSFRYQKLALCKFIVMMLLICHWLACLWAMTLQFVEDDTPRWIDSFEDMEVNIEHKTKDTWWKLYVASLYFTSYTITSVGYGDIGPQNILERFVCIFLIVTAGVSWAYVLGEACGIIGSMGQKETDFRNLMDDLNILMVDRCLPHPLRRRIRAFFLAGRNSQAKNMAQQDLLSMMSPALQGEVAMVINRKWILKVDIMRILMQKAGTRTSINGNPQIEGPTASHQLSDVGGGADGDENADGPVLPEQWYFEGFVVQIAKALTPETYAQAEWFGKPHRLYIVQKGLGLLRTPDRKDRMLKMGSVWGDDFVLSCSELTDQARCWALTYVEVFYLDRDKFMELVTNARSPDLDERLRKYVVRLACQRGIVMEAKKRARAIDSPRRHRVSGDNEGVVNGLFSSDGSRGTREAWS